MNNSFSIEQKPLLSVLGSMQPICSKRTTLDATSYILCNISHNELVLKSTDLEISLQATCQISDCSLADSTSFLVAGKRLMDIVKELDDHITFTLEHNQLSLQSGSVNIALNIKDTQEFPPFPERIENLMHIDAPYLQTLLDKVAFLIPQNNANQALNGLFLEINEEHMKLTSTDGHCLAQVKTSKYTLSESREWLIPRRAIFELKKLIDTDKKGTIFVGTCGNQLVFSGETFNFFTKLLSDKFPAYHMIMDKNGFQPARLERSNFVKTLRRSACLLSGQFLATQFGFEPQKLNVAMQNKEVGKLTEDLPLQEFEGQRMDIRFYAPYLLSGLQTFQDENVVFYLKNSAKPIIFEAEQDACLVTYLVMPVSPTMQS